MKGLAYYASPMDDPYITRNTDTDDELEQDDFQIKPTDNLVAVAKVGIIGYYLMRFSLSLKLGGKR